MENPIVMFTRGEAVEVADIGTKHEKALDVLYNDRGKSITERFTAKWLMNDGRTLVIDYKIMAHGWLDVRCDCETPKILMNPKPFHPFRLTIDASTKKLSALANTVPKDPVARAFLDAEDKHGRTNLNMLLVIYYSSEILLDNLWMLTIRNGNVIRPMPNFTSVAMDYINNRLLEIRNTTLLNGWDSVTLTDKQLNKLVDIFDQKKIDLDFYHYAIEKFCFVNYDSVAKKNHYYFYNLEKGVLNCEYKTPTSPHTMPFQVTFEPLAEEHNTLGLGIDMTLHCASEKDQAVLNHKIDESDKTTWEWITGMFFVINTFMLNYGDVSLEVEEKIATAPSQNKSHKKQNRGASRLFKSYTLKKTWASAVARKHAEITCPCWGVRGHFRHYKNGKVIFIEPHLKGKDKAQYKGKEYALMPYKDA